MLVDWLYVQRRRTPADAFFQRPRSLAGRVVPSSIVAVAIGFVFGFWGDKFLPSVFYNTLPLPVVAAVIAAIVYAVAATIWVPPQAIRPAAAGGGAAADFPSAGAGSV
jgi:hypothetical protein